MKLTTPPGVPGVKKEAKAQTMRPTATRNSATTVPSLCDTDIRISLATMNSLRLSKQYWWALDELSLAAALPENALRIHLGSVSANAMVDGALATELNRTRSVDARSENGPRRSPTDE